MHRSNNPLFAAINNNASVHALFSLIRLVNIDLYITELVIADEGQNVTLLLPKMQIVLRHEGRSIVDIDPGDLR